jgi:hypothetical protein
MGWSWGGVEAGQGGVGLVMASEMVGLVSELSLSPFRSA